MEINKLLSTGERIQKNLKELRNYHNRKRKINGIINDLYDSNFSKKNMEVIIKSVLLQIQGGQI